MNWRGTCLSLGVQYRYGLGLLIVIGLGSITGCAMTKKAYVAITAIDNAKLYAVTADSASFFRRSPQQAQGADTTLPRDTIVTLIRPSLGFSKVKVFNSGEQGYLASEDIKIATPSQIAAATATPAPSASIATSSPAHPRSDEFNLNSADPRLAAPPEALPAPDLPPAAPEPSPGQ